MARTRKSIQSLDLYKYDVLIEDKGTRSEYFKISQFDGYFYGGRNAFLVAGAEVFRPGTKILVEILNKDNTTVYSVPVTNFIEGNSRLIQVEVYNDTPIGVGKIVVLGCVDTYIDGTPVPDEWKGKYNVRWISDVVIAPTVDNKTPIRFLGTPTMDVEEKFYFSPLSSSFSQSINVPVDVELSPKYFNVFPNGYTVTITGPSISSRYYSKYLNGKLTGSLKFYANGKAETASIDLPITKIYNNDTALAEGEVILTDKNTLILSGRISSSGQYTTQLNPIGNVGVTSSLNIQYNELQTTLTADAISFAKIRLVNLATISGEIRKIRLSYKPSSEPGEYVVLGDVVTNVAELLAIDSGSTITSTGKFANVSVHNYWYAATMSVAKNQINPSVPDYYTSSSLVTNNNFLVNCCTSLLDSIDATPEISSSNTTFKNNVSYFIGTRNNNTFELFPNNEYSVKFDALVAKSSASITLNQSDYSMEVYLVPESGSSTRVLDVNSLGQLIGTVNPSPTFLKQNFDTIEFNFRPKILTSGNYSLRFVVYGGFWNIANVSVKAAQEPFFNPDEIDILVPNVNYRNKLLTFKAEYLDINNNSLDVSTLSLPTYFTGSDASGSSTIVFGSGSYEYIDFVTTANPPHQEGRVHWTSDTNTLQVDTEVNNFMIELGHQEVIRGKNTTNGTLTKGTLVYINGEAGQRPTFATASFDSEARSAITVGMVAQDIGQNNTGYAITRGLIRGINTTAHIPGTLLFLSSSGQFTGTAPKAPYHQVRLGFVVTQAVDGKIQLIINNGWELDELHDVKITSETNGDIVVRSGSLWINTKQLTGSYGVTGSFNITNGITGSLFGTASWAQSSSVAFSSSHATTASAATSITFIPLTASFATTSSAATSITFIPLTASFATTSSAATSITFIPLTASFATTSSAATSITFTPITASFAVSSSFARRADGFPYTGSAEITGSLRVENKVGIGVSPTTYTLEVGGDAKITNGALGINVDPNVTDGRLDAGNDIVAYSSSDIRLKKDVTRIADPLERLLKLSGISFRWKQEPEIKIHHGYDDVHDLGIIAQEILELFPEAVRVNKNGYLAVRYERLIPVLVEAIKEQQKYIQELQKRVDTLESKRSVE